MNLQLSLEMDLDRLAALEANWDAQGAKAIDGEIIAAARRFVSALPEDLSWPPKVVPMAKGNLQLEWHDGPRSLELEIDDPKTIHYLKWHPEKGVEEEGLFSIRETSRAEELIQWFTGGIANV